MVETIKKREELILSATEVLDVQVDSASKYGYTVPSGRQAKLSIIIVESDAES